MKKIIVSILLSLCVLTFFVGCNNANQAPDEWVNNTLDPGLK